MKSVLIIFFLIVTCYTTRAQTFKLEINGESKPDNSVIDAIGYEKIHKNAKSISDEVKLFTEKLQLNGYFENELIETIQKKDSLFTAKFKLGKPTTTISIYCNTSKNILLKEIWGFKKDTEKIPVKEVGYFMKKLLNAVEQKGYALSKLKLINLHKHKKELIGELSIILDEKRKLNDIVIKGYDKFPEGYLRHLKKKYRNRIFNQENLKNIYTDFNKIQFIKQSRYPEILFTKDSTNIYVYLEKSKTNSFDGFIGFSNDENKKVIFQGYIDLTLINTLNNGEKMALFWKSDGKDQKTFNASLEIPYIFKSPLGIKSQLNIFKQDSTFQNTKTAIDLGYYFSNNSKLYLGYDATESNDIKNANTATLSDYKNHYTTTTFEFKEYANTDFLFPEKTTVFFKLGTGKRIAKTQYNYQYFGEFDVNYHFYLNQKNAVNLKSQNYYLASNDVIVNELFRFGGINSIRGFNENNLQCNALTSIMTEYQYLIAPTFYINSIVDYAYFQDKSTNKSGKLLGLGFGFGLLTKNGLFNLVYANGSNDDQAIQLSNSIVHISLKTTF